MASNTSKGLDTGTKVIIGVASVALIVAFANSDPDHDAWQDEDDPAEAEAGTVDDQDTVDLDLDEDGETEPPVDDPWTRGAPSGSGDSDDDETEPPVDDPWTRGSDADGGFGDDGLPACVGVSEFQTDDGSVPLPTDRTEDAWASPDCAIGAGGSGNAVWLVQVVLNACNGQAVAVDGVNGAATTQAVAAVQAQHGVTVDGVYGPETREVMAWPTVPDGDAGAATQCVSHPGVG